MSLSSDSGSEGNSRGPFGRAKEEVLVELCASGNVDPAEWRRHGDDFFMAGVATLLGSVRGFDRRVYLDLAEALYPGMSYVETFDVWLQRSPLRAARFVPRLKRRLEMKRNPPQG